MPPSRTELVGTILQDYILEELIGEGGYSWVYKGVNKEDLVNIRAFKVAKPPGAAHVDPKGGFGSRAMVFITGGVTEVEPDQSQLLALQAERIIAAEDPALVSIEEFGMERGYSFCRMEILEGRTLRQMMNEGPINVPLIIHLARSMQRLAANKSFKYHGDLKPENIIVTGGGIKLIDPGYFGAIDTRDGQVDKCMITTPEYYPHLSPDDLFALGIIIWEIACRKHPLSEGGESAHSDLSRIGPDLKSWVRHKEMVGQYFLSPILECGRPSEIRPGLPLPVEQMCLRALQLRFNDENKLDRGPGYGSYDELIEALEGLMEQNIRQL